jgi:hypothetical protein
MITTTERDYLEQDQPIRNQNFVCLSFISPEELLKKKELYYFEKYVETFSTKSNELLNELETLFPDKQHELRVFKENFDFIFNSSKIQQSYNYFLKDKEDELNKEFDKNNSFQTSVRGIKVRGVYDTMQEAEHRSQQLRKQENNKFSIYIAQVGCWCPWYPNPDSIQDQQYSETELNTLMSKYEENIENKDQFFNERKQELMNNIKTEQESIKKDNEQQLQETITSEDPWMEAKNLTIQEDTEEVENSDAAPNDEEKTKENV